MMCGYNKKKIWAAGAMWVEHPPNAREQKEATVMKRHRNQTGFISILDFIAIAYKLTELCALGKDPAASLPKQSIKTLLSRVEGEWAPRHWAFMERVKEKNISGLFQAKTFLRHLFWITLFDLFSSLSTTVALVWQLILHKILLCIDLKTYRCFLFAHPQPHKNGTCKESRAIWLIW